MMLFKNKPLYLLIYLSFIPLCVGALCFGSVAYGEDLSDKVSAKLETVTIGAHELDISSRRGVVTLNGWVSSSKDKNTVLSTVRAMDGVEEVVDLLQIDEKIHAQINLDDNKLGEARIAEVSAAVENYLQGLTLRGPHSLRYELSDQGVIINGELPAGVEKQALLYQVKRKVSSPIVDNIVVRAWPSDSDLKQKVRYDLSGKQGIDLQGISFSVVNGVVTISGKRQNHLQADQLAAAVLMVEGVRDVKSEVTFGGSRDDPR